MYPYLRNALLLVAVVLLPATPTLLHGERRSDQVADNVGQPVLIHNGFMTGQQFRELPEPSRRSYAAGIVDGVLLALGAF